MVPIYRAIKFISPEIILTVNKKNHSIVIIDIIWSLNKFLLNDYVTIISKHSPINIYC